MSRFDRDTPVTSEKIHRRSFLKMGLMGIGAVVVGIPGYSFILDRFWVETTHLTLNLPRLPKAFDGMRLVQFSDIHLGFYYKPENLQGIVHQINRLQPDLICFTGDLVDDKLDGVEKVIPILQKLKAPLGKVAIFGNHDFRGGDPMRVRDTLRNSGFSFLRNSNMTLKRQNSSFHIAGLDDVFGGHPDSKLTLSGIPRDEFTLMLGHEPDLADWDVPYPVDLMLSGHSHGGQIRLPFYGAVYRPDGAKHYMKGLKSLHNNQMYLYVNRGIGTTLLPLRFDCRPEITLFTLKSV